MNDKLPEISPWAQIAAELRLIADDAEKLIGQPAPAAFRINVQPKPHNVPAAVGAVDAIALALLGKPGKTIPMGDDVYHRDAQARRGLINVAVYRRVPEPHAAEIERLRARIAELQALDDPTGLAYTRADDEPDDPTPVRPARVPLHTGAVVDGGQLVDETEPCDPSRHVPAQFPETKCFRCGAPGVVAAYEPDGGQLVDETPAPLVHLALKRRPAKCGMPAEEVGDARTIHPAEATCQDCREAAGLVDETPTEHRLVGGSVGGRGENSAECACGTVFDGFDSATEANLQLDQHITDASVILVDHGPVKPPYGSPERAAYDRRTCVDPGDQEHDHETCRDANAEAVDLVHYRFGMNDTACGLKPGKVRAATPDHAKVTCKACTDRLPS